MGQAQDHRGRFAFDDPRDAPRSGPSWLVVQILAATCGLLLVAAILLPIAMGIRIRDASRRSEALGEQLTSVIKESSALEKENRELRESGGRPELLAEVLTLREERDRLQASLATASAIQPVRSGPDQSSAPVPLPLRELIEGAGAIEVSPRVNDAASKLGIAAGALGFAAQQRLATALPGVRFSAPSSTRLEIEVIAVPYSDSNDGALLVVKVWVKQNWRLDDQRMVTIQLWSSSNADNSTTTALAPKTAETLCTALLDQLLALLRTP